MGWFDQQIRERKAKDDEAFEDSFVRLASSVTGSRASAALENERQKIENSLDEILKFYHLKSVELPSELKSAEDKMEYVFRPYGIMRRTVTLSRNWRKDAVGPMLGTRKDDGSLVALLPHKLGGYCFLDKKTGKYVKINSKNEQEFDNTAISFYKPFPLKKLNIKELCLYLLKCLSISDVVMFAILSLIVSLIGMLTPKLNNVIFSQIVVNGNLRSVIAMAVFLLCVSISSLLINSAKTLFTSRIETKLNLNVESATMMRILSLPANFFKQYNSGELSQRAQDMNNLCEMIVSSAFDLGLTSLFSLIYISQIFHYTPSLVLPALITVLATTVFSILSTIMQMRVSKKKMEAISKESGMTYSMITGIQKIRLSGAEKRAFSRWTDTYTKTAQLRYNPPLFIKLNSVISTAISLISVFVIQYMAVKSAVSVADYYAFDAAYGMVSGAFLSLTSVALNIANIKPILDMAKPLLDTEPEVSEGKPVISRLSGSIELNNISFRYSDNMPDVIDNLSLKIRAGQYVAIVGTTGCGKSTLMRIMLGFEKPQKGAVYYDGRDLESVDLKSLRRKIGVVMQNGKLFQGDIFSNIVISAPQLTLDEAWQAAEMAGMAEDIRKMPMGMQTVISEGSGGISGGQRQRLMIARAIAPKPRILMFDEATSALDNITQKIVSDSLNKLKCTRIVIAHRLSTIRQCDRIIVLDKGKIIEDGTYEELIEKKGFFSELVERQRVDL